MRTTDVLVEGLQFRAAGKDGGALPAFPVGQVLGVPHHPAGDPAASWWCGWENAGTSAASGAQVAADDLVAPAVAEVLKLSKQLDGVGVPFGPELVQVGLVGVELAGPGLAPAGQELFGDCRVRVTPPKTRHSFPKGTKIANGDRGVTGCQWRVLSWISGAGKRHHDQ
ncbi:hypothetical protein [Streptomyces sp. NPDC054975]